MITPQWCVYMCVKSEWCGLLHPILCPHSSFLITFSWYFIRGFISPLLLGSLRPAKGYLFCICVNLCGCVYVSYEIDGNIGSWREKRQREKVKMKLQALIAPLGKCYTFNLSIIEFFPLFFLFSIQWVMNECLTTFSSFLNELSSGRKSSL